MNRTMHWNLPLSRPLLLERRGKKVELLTLIDVAVWISDTFGNVTRSAPLEEAMINLMDAAKSGREADRERATDQVEVAARAHGWTKRS